MWGGKHSRQQSQTFFFARNGLKNRRTCSDLKKVHSDFYEIGLSIGGLTPWWMLHEVWFKHWTASIPLPSLYLTVRQSGVACCAKFCVFLLKEASFRSKKEVK